MEETIKKKTNEEINYAEEASYKYSRFTVEDYIQYRDILESMPYNPELAEFFHDQKKLARRINMKTYRHINEEASYHMNNGTLQISSNESIEECIEEKELSLQLHQALYGLNEVHKRRIIDYFFNSMSLMEIADKEQVSFQAVAESIQTGIKKLKKVLGQP